MSDTTDSEMAKYKKDSRMPCRYGPKCYQKNSAHLDKYKHPPKRTKDDGKPGPSKKIKLQDDVQEETNIQSEGTHKEAAEHANNKITDSEERTNGNNSTEKESEENTNGKDSMEKESEEKKDFDPRAFIKSRFLVSMPDDFFDFWEFCKELKSNNPCEALKDVGLKLVGAYDVLAGNFKHVKKQPEEYLQHWRYYYDPPEVQTVIKGDDGTGYHIGYFYDDPDDPPVFLVGNHGLKDGVFTKMGDNIFAAVSTYLEELKKISDPFKKLRLGKFITSIKNKADKLHLNLSPHSPKIKERENRVVAKTHNKIGLVVPYNKKTQLGYRDLAMSDKDLMTLLTKLQKAAPEQRAKYLSDLQPVLTYANIALDECDFGTGVKLGWEILYHGIDSLDCTILQFLSNSYTLLNKLAFVKIAEAHLRKRKKGCELSIL